jgi:hypothetical protein
MAPNTASIRVGSLLEIRADAGYRMVAAVDSTFDEIERQVSGLPAPHRHSKVIDWRRCPLMAPAVAEQMALRLACTNGTTVRSAVLMRPNMSLNVLQYTRLTRDAGLHDRRVFFEMTERTTWLGVLPGALTGLRPGRDS